VRILVTGATGFIGSAVLAALRNHGHEVVAVVRVDDRSAHRLPTGRVVVRDLARATGPQSWLGHLDGVDAVVNCAGVLQDTSRDSTAGVHVRGVAALFEACERAGVRRVIHLSAIGADPAAPTAFSRTKFQGEQSLMARDLDWVILRPAVVVGRSAYGGSALLRALATLPLLPLEAQSGAVQTVQLDEVTQTVLFFLNPDAPARKVLELADPTQMSVEGVIRCYRRWLGWPPARTVHLPSWLASAIYGVGDLLGWLGWRPPIRGTARREAARATVADPSEWRRITGIEPRDLPTALAAEPASVQEHWFAQLYLIKPIVLGSLSLFWLFTGLIALGPGFSMGRTLLENAGADDTLASIAVIAGATADVLMGIAIAVRRTARPALVAALAISFLYLVVGTILIPRLWIEPLGPLVKSVPIIVLNLVALAILDDR